MRILHINTRIDAGGSARIMNELIHLQINNGYQIRVFAPYKNKFLFKIENRSSIIPYINYLAHKLFGFDVFTIDYFKLRKYIKQCDIIHLHVIHGFFLNYNTLFRLITKYNKPVCVTLHDMWYFTGRCAIPLNCTQLEKNCKSCPDLKIYPSSIFDFAYYHNKKKKSYFNQIEKLIFVSPSKWMLNISQRIMFNKKIFLINNGINFDNTNLCLNDSLPKIYDYIFVTTDFNDSNKVSLSVISKIIDSGLKIVLIGKNQPRFINQNVTQIDNVLENKEVLNFMKLSRNFLILSKFENFPTVLIEALVCGCFIISTRNNGSLDILSNFQENIDFVFFDENKLEKFNFSFSQLESDLIEKRIILAKSLYSNIVMFEKYNSAYNYLLNI
jgi:putative colanic acid biosynthesis glycosyltransferase